MPFGTVPSRVHDQVGAFISLTLKSFISISSILSHHNPELPIVSSKLLTTDRMSHFSALTVSIATLKAVFKLTRAYSAYTECNGPTLYYQGNNNTRLAQPITN